MADAAHQDALPLAYLGVPRAGGARLHADHDPAAVRHAAAVALQQRSTSSRSSSASTTSAPCSATRAGRPASGTRSATTSGSSSSTCWCRTRSASLLAALLSSPEAALPRLLPHRDLRPDHPVLRHRRLRLEADPVADLGRRADHARRRRPEEPVRALARQGRLCADHRSR